MAPLAAGDPARYLALTGGLALMTGAWMLLAGVIGLGFVTRFLSRPLLLGYVAGSAIVMIVSQLDSLIGIKLEAQDDTIAELTETISRLGETDLTTLLVGLGVIGVVLLVRRIDRRLPAYLVAVLAAIAVSAIADLAAKGVAVVGTIQPGLPAVGLPAVSLADLASLAGPAIGIALLVYADSGVTGQVLGRRGGYAVDGNQEFLGLGAANIGSALTGGFPVNGSQSRSFTAADVGAKSQAMNLGRARPRDPDPAVPHAPVRAAAEVRPGRGDHRRRLRAARSGRLPRPRPGGPRASWASPSLTAAIVVAVGMIAGVLVTVVLSPVPRGDPRGPAAPHVPRPRARDGQLPGRGQRGGRRPRCPAWWSTGSTGRSSSPTPSCSPTTSRRRWPRERRASRSAGS